MNTEPTNQPPEWAVKAAGCVILRVAKDQGERVIHFKMPNQYTLAEIIASHAPKESVNQDLASALRFMCSQLEHLAKTHWPEPDEAEQFLKQCDALRCARSALKSAEQPAH